MKYRIIVAEYICFTPIYRAQQKFLNLLWIDCPDETIYDAANKTVGSSYSDDLHRVEQYIESSIESDKNKYPKVIKEYN